jgi:hypothetical protein
MNGRQEEKAPVVAVPADLEVPDRVIGPFTARQALILGLGCAGVYLVGSVLAPFVPPPMLAVCALVLAGLLLVFVATQRDGLNLDQLTGLAVAFVLRPRRCAADAGSAGSSSDGLAVLSPNSVACLTEGVLDLGGSGTVALVECGTMNLSLFSNEEARSALAALGAVLNAVGGTFQVVAVAQRLDLQAHSELLELEAAQLPGGALRAAASQHAEFLRELTGGTALYGRRVLLVLREPGPTARGGPILVARAAQVVQLLGACGLTARQLGTAEAAAAVAAACDPQRGPAAPLLDLSSAPTLKAT